MSSRPRQHASIRRTVEVDSLGKFQPQPGVLRMPEHGCSPRQDRSGRILNRMVANTSSLATPTVSSTDTASSSAPSEPFDLERDIPTTEEDIRVQRSLRRQPGENLATHLDEFLNPRQFENISPKRTTSEGWEPFELD